MSHLKPILLLLTILILGCKDNVETNLSSQDSGVLIQECFSKLDKENALQAIFENQDFQTFLHPEIEDRLPLKIVKTQFITKDLGIYIKDNKSLITDSTDVSEATVRLKIENKNCQSKKIAYVLFYPIEGAFVKGEVIKNDKIWVVNVESSGEIGEKSVGYKLN